ncbi:MAG TPA: glycosyltransferase family 2 protein [Candidatus Aenigmarchaeota archaeon]|nr:glycosyltransferase family 2 protein [Candidatus Aenigmarchaeota archaeon]HEX32993.1 glycosyltransferase family 2 protein [Candidatus Aenigmarchaeota archaeon]
MIFNYFILTLSFISLFTSIFYFLLYVFIDEEKKKSSYKPSVTIIIPAYNEQARISRCLDSVVSQDYPLEAIVVDDGSTDNTASIVNSYVKKYKNVKLIQKEREGKVPSVNKVLKGVKTDLFCVLDADTFLVGKDAVRKAVRYFSDKKVAAVLTALEVYNKENMLTLLQAIEYYITIFVRRVSSFFNGVLSTHGATFFRTDYVRKVGYFDENNLVEDMEIALRLIDHGYKVISVMDVKSSTYAPTKFTHLVKQRLRWYTGNLENIVKYRHLLFNKNSAGLGFFTIPLSLVWVGAFVYLFTRILYKGVSSALLQYSILRYLNFDFLFYLDQQFGPTVLGLVDVVNLISLSTFIMLLFLVYTLFFKGNLSRLVVSALFYLLVGTLLYGALWVASIVNVFVRERRPWLTEKTDVY